MEVEKYDPETGEVTFKTKHLSDYVIYAVDAADIYLEQAFTFKGYSFSWTGALAVGFSVNYEAIDAYNELTGTSMIFGVVFADYQALGGKQPHEVEERIFYVLNDYDYLDYDFVVTDLTEEYYDYEMVIGAFISAGGEMKYVQENGVSDTVHSITYNEAKGA